ncbi:MAG: hypothetical protein WCK42_00705 [Myxococcaceae bacterium]
MVTRQNRILLLCIPVLLQMACGSGNPQQPDLIAGLWQSADKKTQTPLTLIDWYSPETKGLVEDALDGLVTVASTATGLDKICLGFSVPIAGNAIEQVTPSILQNEITPIPNSGAVEIWQYTSLSQTPTQLTETTDFTLIYRPDGGYVPPSDTSISNFPPPAIVVQFTKQLISKNIFVVYLIAGKISDSDRIFMAQVKDSTGKPIVTYGGSPVAGTIWFQTN